MSTNRPDELLLAEMFVRIVHDDGIARAAQRLGLSPSRLSRGLAELEALLGSRLLVRTTRRQHLTEAGHVYLEHARRLLAQRAAAHDAVAELRGGVPRGRLRVTMPVAIGERLLALHLPAFRARYPELRVEIDLSDRLQPLGTAGFDLAIRLGPPGESGLRVRRVGLVSMCLVASPDYLARRGEPQAPADLADHDLIGLGPIESAYAWPFWRGEERAVVPVEPGLHTTNPGLAAQLAANGVGVLRVPRWVVGAELESGALVAVMDAWRCDDPKRGGVPLWVVYAQEGGAEIPLKSRVFVELIVALTQVELDAAS